MIVLDKAGSINIYNFKNYKKVKKTNYKYCNF